MPKSKTSKSVASKRRSSKINSKSKMRGGMIKSGTVVSNLPKRSKKSSKNTLRKNKTRRLSKKNNRK